MTDKGKHWALAAIPLCAIYVLTQFDGPGVLLKEILPSPLIAKSHLEIYGLLLYLHTIIIITK